MRASRLISLLLLLQTRGRMTAAAIAQELEVSVRTIYRDLDALSAAGVPVYAEPGLHGGCQLVDGYRTRLTGLTAPEAEALFLSGVRGPVGELGLGTVLAAAQLKVLAALPPELRSRATRVQERFLLDAPGWFQSDDDVPHLAALAEALWDERRVAARYARADKVVTRTLDPLGLVCKAGVWYLVARHRADIRTYRVSRLQKVTVTERRFERPDAFVLDVHWAESSRDFEASILHLDVRVRISAAGLRALRRQVEPASATAALEGAGEPDEDGWVETTIPVEGLPHGHQVMLRLGTAVEVLEPTELREMLGNTARTLAGRYT